MSRRDFDATLRAVLDDLAAPVMPPYAAEVAAVARRERQRRGPSVWVARVADALAGRAVVALGRTAIVFMALLLLALLAVMLVGVLGHRVTPAPALPVVLVDVGHDRVDAIDPSTGERRTLADGELWSISPDGRWFAWSEVGASSRRRLVVGRIDGSEERSLSHGNVVGPAGWSPDASRFALVHPGRLEILDLTTPAAPPRSVPLDPDLPPLEDVQWSPTGDRIALAVDADASGEVQHLYLLDPVSGETLGPIADDGRPLQLITQLGQVIAWSHDGRSIALIDGAALDLEADDSQPSKRGGRVVVLDARTGLVSPLPAAPADPQTIWGWSGDDRALGVDRTILTGGGTVAASLPPATGTAGIEACESVPAWSPAGDRVAVSTRDGLVLAAGPGGEAHTLATNLCGDGRDRVQLVWAPGGDRIGVLTRSGPTSGSWALAIVDVTSGVVHPLSGGGVPSAWNPVQVVFGGTGE